MPIVQPAGMVEDRVKANTFHGNSLADSPKDFRANIREPAGTPVILNTRLGDKNGALITLVKLGDDRVKRTVLRMKGVDRKPVMNPLVVTVEVHAQDV